MEFIKRTWFLLLLIALTLYGAWAGSGAVFHSLKDEKPASSLYGWDTSFYYFWLRSLALDGDVDFENDIHLSDTMPGQQKRFALQGLARTPTGKVANKYPVGWALFHAPWFGLGHGTSLMLEKFEIDVRTDGYGKVYERFVYAGSVVYALLGLWLTYLLLRRFFEWELSLLGLLAVWSSGFLIYYQLNQYAMSHNLTYLCVVSSFYWSLAIREMPPLKRNWFMLGLSVGLLLITRYQGGVYLIFPFMVCAVEVFSRRATLKAAAVCLATIVVIVSIQLFAWKSLYGSWLVYSYQGEGFLWKEPAVWQSLFDPFHGLMYWHPVFLLGFVGLIGFSVWRKDWLGWFIPLSFVAMVYVNSAWETWWFGASFGGRAYEGASLFVCFGVGWLIWISQRSGVFATWGLRIVLLCLVVWNIGVLEVSVFNWKTGLSMEEPLRYSDFWEAMRHYYFSSGK